MRMLTEATGAYTLTQVGARVEICIYIYIQCECVNLGMHPRVYACVHKLRILKIAQAVLKIYFICLRGLKVRIPAGIL